jgi:hypothetical protein
MGGITWKGVDYTRIIYACDHVEKMPRHHPPVELDHVSGRVGHRNAAHGHAIANRQSRGTGVDVAGGVDVEEGSISLKAFKKIGREQLAYPL